MKGTRQDEASLRIRHLELTRIDVRLGRHVVQPSSQSCKFEQSPAVELRVAGTEGVPLSNGNVGGAERTREAI